MRVLRVLESVGMDLAAQLRRRSGSMGEAGTLMAANSLVKQSRQLSWESWSMASFTADQQKEMMSWLSEYGSRNFERYLDSSE